MTKQQHIIFHKDTVALPARVSEQQLAAMALHAVGEIEGTRYVAAHMQTPEGFAFESLRDVLKNSPESLQKILTRAFQIIYWHKRNKYCGACGDTLVQSDKAFEKCCRQCQALFHPSLSPAVIVLIHKKDALLLARSAHFKPGVYGLVAGFVDPGETAEAAVHREILEEVNINVKNIQYQGSQSWPFPSTLMLGFSAEYDSGEIILNDGELEHAAWFDKDKLPATSGGISISNQLIKKFLKDGMK